MTEKLLHFIWQFGYFTKTPLYTTSGEEVQILFPGRINTNQGPDFSEAKIRIGTTVLAGSVELHIHTSDWNKHQHGRDNHYRNIILHVVYHHDTEAAPHLPTLELSPLVPKVLLQRWEALMAESDLIPCAGTIGSIKKITWMGWKERLLAERLTRKAALVMSYLQKNKNHWEETFWWLLARNFGIKVNADAFEQIAQSLPVTLMAKHKTVVHQLEALLFGQAGLLKEVVDEYSGGLHTEYVFLKAKYGLQPVSVAPYFLRMRPGNFPTIRLAQLAILLHRSEHLFSKITEAEKVADVKELFAVSPSAYWHTHFRFGEASPFSQKKLGAGMINTIFINTVVPLLFAYGLFLNEEKYIRKALSWLEQTEAENNSILKGFARIGVTNKSAYDSQALLELKNEYCLHKRCLECSVGTAILSMG